MEQTVSKKEFKGFSGNELKVFAIIAMLMDHLASTIWPGYHKDWWLLAIHLFGRLAAPTMWFMIAEGYRYTRNFQKYLARLFISFWCCVYWHFHRTGHAFRYYVPYIFTRTGET